MCKIRRNLHPTTRLQSVIAPWSAVAKFADMLASEKSQEVGCCVDTYYHIQAAASFDRTSCYKWLNVKRPHIWAIQPTHRHRCRFALNAIFFLIFSAAQLTRWEETVPSISHVLSRDLLSASCFFCFSEKNHEKKENDYNTFGFSAFADAEEWRGD